MNVHRVVLLGLISMVVVACDPRANADFDMVLDPNVRGKVNLINHSTNAKNFQWELTFSETENGNYSGGSGYGNYGYYDGDVTEIYIKENSWIEVTLAATGATSESHSERLQVNNVPTQVVLGDIVITKVKLTDNLGYEWDDADGTTTDGVYDIASEYPDLLINNSPTSNSFSATDVVWDVDIENGLPITLITENAYFEDLNASSNSNYYVELLDFDGQVGSIFGEVGKRIGVVNIDVYRLTHEQNGGSDDNFPEIYKIVEDGFEADLYMNWD